jgi:hypothetical protein
MEKKYKYLGYILLLLIPLTFAGFFKTYIGQFPNFEETIDTFIHLHAVIATIWILTIIIQPLLILNKKNSIHRKLGRISYIVFPLLILSFIPQMMKIIISGNIKYLFFSVADTVLLIAFYSSAIYFRKSVPKHMRYMILAALVFLGPTIGRIGNILLGLSPLVSQNILYGVIYILLVSLIFYDKSNKKNYSPYLIGLSCYAVHQVIFHIVFLDILV